MGVVGWGAAPIIPFSFILGNGYNPSVEHLVFRNYTVAEGPNGENRTYTCFYLEPDDRFDHMHHIYIYMVKNASYRGINNVRHGYDIVDKSLLPT